MDRLQPPRHLLVAAALRRPGHAHGACLQDAFLKMTDESVMARFDAEFAQFLSWTRRQGWAPTGTLVRSPAGTGACAIRAALHARGELRVGEPFEHSSILGTKFIGRLHEGSGFGCSENLQTICRRKRHQ